MKRNRDSIGEAIVESYKKHGGINHIDGVNLPSRDAIIEITDDLLKLVFPGFYDRNPIHSLEIPDYAQELMSSISRRLQHEIHKSLEYRPCPNCDKSHLDSESVRVTYEFLSEIPTVRGILQTDVVAAYEGDPAAISHEEIIVSYPGMMAIAVQRMAHILYQKHIALIPRIMTEYAHSRTGIDIHPGAQIGPSFFIDHGTGVVIGETSVIGKHVKIYQGVTLGAKSFRKDDEGHIVKGNKRHPNIDDDVTIYAGATILGDVTIGKGSVIGGNVWLLDSVPPNTVVYYEGGQTKTKPTDDKMKKMMLGQQPTK